MRSNQKNVPVSGDAILQLILQKQLWVSQYTIMKHEVGIMNQGEQRKEYSRNSLFMILDSDLSS